MNVRKKCAIALKTSKNVKQSLSDGKFINLKKYKL
jgi:hypothetical protein